MASTAGDAAIHSSAGDSRSLVRNENSSAVQQQATNGEARGGENGDQQQPREQRGTSVLQIIRSVAINAMVVYFVTSFFRRSPAPSSVSSGPDVRQPSSNLFSNGTVFDMLVYVSESEHFKDFDDEAALVWKQSSLMYGDWTSGPNEDGIFTNAVEIQASENVQNNGTLYIHIYLVREGKSPDPTKKGLYSKKYTVYRRKLLNRYKKRRYQKTHNLLTGATSASQEVVEKAANMSVEISSHWHPNLTINIVTDYTAWVKGSVPPPLDEFIEFDDAGEVYYPIVYLNEYWNLLREYMPINKSTKVLNLTLTYQPLTLFRWQLYSAQSMRSKWTSAFLGEGLVDENEEDQDSLKEAFLETNILLLGLTVVVSLLHSVFEFLAFKNDIQFWKSRTNLEGLSVRSVFFNVFQSLVVLLYVLDNETNTIVRVSVFIGLAIEVWKIHKVMNIGINREQKWFGIIPKITISDKGSYVESSTKQYDMLAFKYLSWVLFPLLGGYCVYSLLYQEHKGWYSWVLSMLYGFLLTFGFIMMTPQLFINYKLKSVAHLPWRMMTYKALNTFIDDIFAFVIKMPTLYRLGCLRDDVVFFIYLYQRWIYRVDPKRINEFGTSGEMEKPIEASSEPAVLQAALPPSASSSKKSPRRKKND